MWRFFVEEVKHMTLKRIIITGFVISSFAVFSVGSVYASGRFDNWRGILVQNPNEDNVYDEASGHVNLNYVSGRGSWAINLVTRGLVPGESYQAIFYKGGSPAYYSLGCFVADEDGVGKLHDNDYPVDQIDPTTNVAGGPRVNVRLQNTVKTGCVGLENSAVMTTGTGWGSDGLIQAGSNRPDPS